MVRHSSHLAAVPLEEPDFASAHAKAPGVHLMIPKETATLLVPNEGGLPQTSHAHHGGPPAD